MLLREKGNQDAEPVSMSWDEAQAALQAGTHEAVTGQTADQDIEHPDADGLDKLTRAELDAKAVERGLDPAGFETKADVIAALKAPRQP